MGMSSQIHRSAIEPRAHISRLQCPIQVILNRQVIRVALDCAERRTDGVKVAVVGPGDDGARNFGRGIEGVEPCLLCP